MSRIHIDVDVFGVTIRRRALPSSPGSASSMIMKSTILWTLGLMLLSTVYSAIHTSLRYCIHTESSYNIPPYLEVVVNIVLEAYPTVLDITSVVWTTSRS